MALLVVVVHDNNNSKTVATSSWEKNIVAFTVPAAGEKILDALGASVRFCSGVPRTACQST
jgi:hypothetical protein